MKKRFGQLVAIHRRRRGMTQEELAIAAELSIDMIGKVENGASGARFPAIQRIASALSVDPAELFTTAIPNGNIQSEIFKEASLRLARLSDTDLRKLLRVLDVLDGAYEERDCNSCERFR